MLRSILAWARAEVALVVGQRALYELTGSRLAFLYPVERTVALAVVLSLVTWASWNVAGVYVRAVRDASGRAARKRAELRALPDPGLLVIGLDARGRTVYAPAITGSTVMLVQAVLTGRQARYVTVVPPVVTRTGPQPASTAWAQDSVTVPPGGVCGKCGQPMAGHLYYGRGACETAAPGAVNGHQGWVRAAPGPLNREDH
jgi:hypothetical protein